jgi:hypothetical protein
MLTPAELAALEAHHSAQLHTRKGQAGRWSRLPDETVARIRDLKAQGLSQARIAAEVGCTQPAVSMILHGKRRAP